MPRIDPLKLLVCLSVLLAPNGGIRSANEVKRLANLMAKFSKKLVSKCIYIQILKCTETELLGQFMAAGGWSLVHMWLADGITTKNWPLIQELLELLLCCPVDVDRLKSNTAPKLVKSLSKDSSHEGVRLLASKLVEQWLKIARNDIRSGNPQQQTNQPSQPQSVASQPGVTVDKVVDDDCEMQEEEEDVQEHPQVVIEESQDGVDEDTMVEESILPDDGPIESETEQQQDRDDSYRMVDGQNGVEGCDKATAETTTADEINAKKSPLLFKITTKNGKQMLAKVESPVKGQTDGNVEEEEKNEKAIVKDEKSKDEGKTKEEMVAAEKSPEVDEKDSTENIHKDDDIKPKGEKLDESSKDKEKDRRKSSDSDRSKEKSSSKDKDRHRDKDRKSSSSSSSHRSSSKSSSSKHNSSNSSSSSSRSKSSSSSSNSKSSSSSSRDKDKEKDRNGSSSSNSSSSKSHHKSSSSSSTSQKSSSKSSSVNEKHREHRDKEKEKDKSSHSGKDKDGQPKLSSPSINKLSKISRKSKDSEEDKSDSSANHKSSPISASKKASISIEVRNAEHRPKTVKTYNSQFRSHGLIEEAPPPPSRKGLKKPSQAPTTPPVIGSTATGTIPVKRSSPPPFTGPPEKRLREDLAERPGAIKLIPAKRQPSLVESDMFMDALSATLKKDVKKRKRRPSGSESTKATDKAAAPAVTPEKSSSGCASSPDKSVSTPPASPTGEKTIASTPLSSPTGNDQSANVSTSPSSPAKVVAVPMSFYRDTLADTDENAEAKKEGEEDAKEKVELPEAVEDVEIKSDEVLDKTAEPDDAEDEIIRKPKRLKSQLIDDDDADDKGSLIDAVGDDLTKKMALLEGGQSDIPDIPVKKPPGPGCGPDGPPGVLVIHRRKGPKKQLKWKSPDDLEEIRYFELDVTERCNVTKTFTDLKQMERVDERQKYILSRKLQTEDVMVERTPWLPLIIVDNIQPHPDGVNSQERRIQRDRERTVLQALYFNRHMIPESPAEPDVEVYSISEPAHIPMEDVTGNPDSVNDFTSMPWPEPKSTPPNESAGFNSPFFPGSGNDFPPFGSSSSWDLPGAVPGAGPSPIPSLFASGRIPIGIPPSGGNNGPPSGGPNMMRQMNIPPNIAPNIPPHANMFPNNFARGPPPPQMQHILDSDEDNFRNGPPPPPSWFNNNRCPPPPHIGSNFNNNRGGFGNRGGSNWNNNRDNDRGGPRGGNYRPPWLQNRGTHRGRKW